MGRRKRSAAKWHPHPSGDPGGQKRDRWELALPVNSPPQDLPQGHPIPQSLSLCGERTQRGRRQTADPAGGRGRLRPQITCQDQHPRPRPQSPPLTVQVPVPCPPSSYTQGESTPEQNQMKRRKKKEDLHYTFHNDRIYKQKLSTYFCSLFSFSLMLTLYFLRRISTLQ